MSGFWGGRGARRSFTAFDRRSASVIGFTGRPRLSLRLAGRPPRRSSVPPRPRPPAVGCVERVPGLPALEPGLPDGRRGPLLRASSRRGGREFEPEDMGRHATGHRRQRCRSEPKTRRTHCRQTRAVRSSIEIRRRPTLPGDLSPSTIGADRLNFRVRDGNGCDPVAMVTEISCQ